MTIEKSMDRIVKLNVFLIFTLIACTPRPTNSDISATQVEAAQPQVTPLIQSTSEMVLTPTQTLTPYPTQTVIADPLSNTKVDNGCLPPSETHTYALAESDPLPTPRAAVLPIGWREITKIPEEFAGDLAYIQFMRTNSGRDELWISIDIGTQFFDTDDAYFIYHTDTQEWERTLTPPGSRILLGSNSSIWSLVYTGKESVSNLYQLDEKAHQYASITDVDGLLQTGNIYSPIILDSAGVLWFLFGKSGGADKMLLYSFNPSTRQAERHPIGIGFDNFVIDREDNIYLLQNRSQLVKYSPKTGVLHSVDMPGGHVENGTSLFIDSKERLWVSDIARFDEAVSNPEIGTPTLLPRSPIFIRLFAPYGRFVWFRPQINVESLDGRLWYDGQAWFDPDKEEWCLFTTHETKLGFSYYNSQIVKDSKQNLWMVADGRLFKYEINP